MNETTTETEPTVTNTVTVGSLHDGDRRVGPEMFWLSLASLLFLAGILHVNEKVEYKYVFIGCVIGFLAIYPACWVEAIWATWRGSRLQRKWLYCVLPPLRMAAWDHGTASHIWLPGLGWQRVNHDLELKLERITSVPMVIMALMVLPLIAIEHYWAERLLADPRLSGLEKGATGLIWLAFAAELIIRFSIAERKWDYFLSHWIDLIIVILPLLSFLRAVQLGRLLRVQQLTRTVRVYRLRGVAMRAWRALLLIDAVNRVLNGPPERRIVKLEDLVAKKEQELADIRAEIERLRGLHATGMARQTEATRSPSATGDELASATVSQRRSA